MIDEIRKYVENQFGFLEKEVRENLIDTAIESLKEEKINLLKVLDKDDKKEILKALHKLKGVLLNSGFEELATGLKEEELKNLEIEKLKETIKQLLEKITI